MVGVHNVYLGSYFDNKLVPDWKGRIKIGVYGSGEGVIVLLSKALLFFYLLVLAGFISLQFSFGIIRLGNTY